MFETVFDEITWDIHGSRPFTDIAEMSRLVARNVIAVLDGDPPLTPVA